MVNFDINVEIPILEPLIGLIIGMAVYGIIVFRFYKLLAKRDLFTLNLEKHNSSKHSSFGKAIESTLYLFKYLLIFPIITFLSFVALAILISFISTSSSVEHIFLISMAVIGSVRACSYYSEYLAEDMAKLLPFTLLAIFLADISTFSISKVTNTLMSIPSYYMLLAHYLGFAILLELVMRLLYWIVIKIFPPQNKPI
jgi:hypothetical protein